MLILMSFNQNCLLILLKLSYGSSLAKGEAWGPYLNVIWSKSTAHMEKTFNGIIFYRENIRE